MNTIDSIPGIGNVQVPDGLFRSARANKTRRDAREMLLPTSLASETVIRSAISYSNHIGTVAHTSHLEPVAVLTPIRTSALPTSRSSSTTSSPVSMHSPMSFPGQLVPLHYLENTASPRREPTDEQLLRRFNTVSSRRVS